MTSTTTSKLGARAKSLLAGEWRRVRKDTFRALLWILAATAIAALIETIGVAFRRIAYPYTLEWMEGGVVDHVRVVLAGKPLYVKPSFLWTPYIYTPLYYWVTAAFAKVFGATIFTARLVSVLSMLGSFAMIVQHVRKEAGGYVAPIAAAALFAATFKVTGYWMDLARIDSLFCFVLLVAIYVARHGKGHRSAAAAGVLFTAAFFTKQSGLLLAMPALGGLIVMNWRRGLVAAGVFGVAMAASIGWMNHASGGWFNYYVFTVPGHHEVDTKQWHEFTIKAVWRPMPFAVLLAIFAFLLGAFGERHRSISVFWSGILVGAWVHGASGLAHIGGSDNAVIPSCAVLAILAGIALQWIFVQASTTELSIRLKCFAAVATMLQLSVLSYDPRECLPRKRDVAAGNEMMARLEKRPAPMYSFGFGFYLSRIGRPEIYAHSMAMADIFRADPKFQNKELLDDIVAHIRSGEFETIVVDQSMGLLPWEVRQAVEANYAFASYNYDNDAGWPKTAWGSRPADIWLKKPH